MRYLRDKNKFNRMKTRLFLIVSALWIMAGCDPEIEGYKPTSGDADFSVYVALGNSITAGYADAELFKSGQMVSYANIIAKQMLHAGGGEFKQPLMRDEYGFGGRIKLGMATDCIGNTGLGGVFFGESPEAGNFSNIYAEEGPFHNMGVPGAQVSHLLLPGYSMLNPYYSRFASSSTARIIDDATALNPTFFSLWIGNNDVLGYASSGGMSGSITPPEQFEIYYNLIVNQLLSETSKGILANIPDITSIPFFNTIPARGLVLMNPDEITSLNDHYSSQGLHHINFQMGVNGFVVSDPSAPQGIRQLASYELMLVTLPQDSLKCAGWGSTKPIPMQYYLSELQVKEIREAIKAYNSIIGNAAAENNIALADVNHLLTEAKSGMIFDGIHFNTQYVTGGLFSLDGVHLSPRGNAVVANYFIDVINEHYGAGIPKVSVTQYQGIIFP